MARRETRLTVAMVVGCVLMVPAVLLALQPPRNGERGDYIKDGSFAQRAQNAARLGNHRTSPRLVNNLKRQLAKAGRLAGVAMADADSATADSKAGVENAPPPDWQGGLPATGAPRTFVLLVEFPDQPHSSAQTQEDVNKKMFGDGDPNAAPYDSLRNFYRRSSYGLLELQGTVFNWYRARYARSYYEQIGFGAGQEVLIEEAISAINANGHDFSQYDNDGDGVIDAFYVKWTGPNNGWANFWWAYEWVWHVDPLFVVDGKQLGRYVWSWISTSDAAYEPRVDIHETGHLLGLPDLYDYDADVGPDGGVGGLDMMDANWGDHNCFSKYMLGWLTPQEVLTGDRTITLAPSGTTTDCVLIMSGLSPGTLFGEFFMVQYRKRLMGNDPASYPTDGLLVWHVDSTLTGGGSDFLYDNSNTAHKYLRLMEADGLEQIERESGYADSGDYYTPGRQIGVETLPSTRRYAGVSTGVAVDQIGWTDGGMSARFRILPAVKIIPGKLKIVEESCLPANGAIDPGETVRLRLDVSNTGWGPTSNLVATLQATGGATLPCPPQSYGVVQPSGGSASAIFTFTAEGQCGDPIVLTLQLSDNGTILDPIAFSHVLGSRRTTEDFDSISSGALPAYWSTHVSVGTASGWSATNALSASSPMSLFATAPDGMSDDWLTSPVHTLSSSHSFLSFRHKYQFTGGNDGGVLEMSIAGSVFQDVLAAGGTFVSNGYNTTLVTDSGHPLAGRQAWSGSSSGFVTTQVALPYLVAGQNVQFRWRLGTDYYTASPGWFIDDVSLDEEGLCCDLQGISVESDWLSVPENGTATLRMRLARPPADTVVVSVAKSSGDNDLNIVGASTAVFTTADWDQYHDITIEAQPDDDAIAGQAVFVCSAPDMNSRQITVTEIDDDSMALWCSATSLTVPEGGTASFRVRLTAQPSATVTVSAVRSWGDTDIVVQTPSLVFSSSNWNVEQVVTVAAATDADAVVGQATVRLSATGLASVDIAVLEQDNDVVALQVDPTSLQLDEGTSATVRVRLAAAPKSSVTVAASRLSGDTSIRVTGGSSLTFTTSNWSAWKTATIAAQNDADAIDGQAVIRFSGTGVFPQDLTVTTHDDDLLTIVPSVATVTVPEGLLAAFSLRLGAQPPGNVTVDVRVEGDSDIYVAFGGRLYFTPSNWNEYQSVTLAAGNDDDVVDEHASVVLSADGLPSVILAATENDDDVLAIVTQAKSVLVSEGGTAEMLVRLSAKPPSAVEVSASVVAGDADISIQSGDRLTFTPENWSTRQPVVVAAADDLDVQNGWAMIRCSAAGLSERDFQVTEVDNGFVYPTWYRDADGDGAGDPADHVQAFSQPDGYVAEPSDCDDTDPAVSPTAAEVCGNEIDDNCNGEIDEDCMPDTSADADDDGVPDVLDTCPATPAGTQVDRRGCPIDSTDDSDTTGDDGSSDDGDTPSRPNPENLQTPDNSEDEIAVDSGAQSPASTSVPVCGLGVTEAMLTSLAVLSLGYTSRRRGRLHQP